MKSWFLLVAGVSLAPLALAQQCAHADHPYTYPATERGTQVDTLHGVRIADPYRWLEDPDSDKTRAKLAGPESGTRRHPRPPHHPLEYGTLQHAAKAGRLVSVRAQRWFA